MKRSGAAFVLSALLVIALPSAGWAQEGPNRPQPKAVSLERKSTAILVLDLNARCHDPQQVCSKLMPAVAEFLEKARASSVPIIHTVSASAKGKPLGEIAAPLKRPSDEPVVYPDAFDKFMGGELQDFLKQKGARTVVIVGSSTNVSVLYTASTAARVYRYNVVIPIDGVNTASNYEQDYALHQFTVLPGGASKLFQFTNLSMINFK